MEGDSGEVRPTRPEGGISVFGQVRDYGTTAGWRRNQDHRLASEANRHRHRCNVGEIDTEERLTRALMEDFESLLIYGVHQIQPLCNLKNTAKLAHCWRPGMKVVCLGVWPLSQKIFADED